MSLSIPSQIAVPFANAGLRAAIPANSNNVTGRAGYDQGFPPINLTPKVAGGIPPFGQDMNGTLYDATRAIQFTQAGSSFVYNSTFATAIGGYRPGARVLRTDGFGYWLNTIDGNSVDPEGAGAAAAGWVPDYTNGIAAITMTNANVTLTPLQYGRPIVLITGTLTANLNLIFPSIADQWTVINNTTGAFSITCKTAAGSGVVVSIPSSIVGDGVNIYTATPVSDSSVGDVKQAARSSTPAGWLKLNGGTIGSAASGATARANADTLALFTLLWTDFPQSVLPIQTSAGGASTRGASAAADFAANKRLPIFDMRAEFPRGADDGRGIDTGRVLGSSQASTTIQTITDNNGSIAFTNPDTTTVLATTTGFNTTGVSGRAVSANSLRPRNVAFHFFIKY